MLFLSTSRNTSVRAAAPAHFSAFRYRRGYTRLPAVSLTHGQLSCMLDFDARALSGLFPTRWDCHLGDLLLVNTIFVSYNPTADSLRFCSRSWDGFANPPLAACCFSWSNRTSVTVSRTSCIHTSGMCQILMSMSTHMYRYTAEKLGRHNNDRCLS